MLSDRLDSETCPPVGLCPRQNLQCCLSGLSGDSEPTLTESLALVSASLCELSSLLGDGVTPELLGDTNLPEDGVASLGDAYLPEEGVMSGLLGEKSLPEEGVTSRLVGDTCFPGEGVMSGLVGDTCLPGESATPGLLREKSLPAEGVAPELFADA